MTPLIELVLRGGDAEKTLVYACGKCKLTAHSKEFAEACCATPTCHTCGKECDRGYCKACADKKHNERLQKQFESAEKVTLAEYQGTYLYCPVAEEYYRDFEEFLEAQVMTDIPKWVFGTTKISPSTDAQGLVESALCDEFHEGAGEDITDEQIRALQEFLNGWWKETEIVSFVEDPSVVVTFEKEVEEYLKDNSDD